MFRPVRLVTAFGLLTAALAGCTTASDGGGPATPSFSGPPVIIESAPSSSTDPGPTPTPSSGVSRANVCPPEHMTPRVVDKGQRGKYYWVVVSLTNRGPHTCKVVGYPQLTALGGSPFGLAQTVTLPVRTMAGTVGDRRDLGRHSVGVAIGGSTSFAVSSYVGLKKHWTITDLGIRPAGAYGQAHLRVTLPSSQNGYESIPLTVTGFVAGAAGPPVIPPKATPTRR